MASLPYYFYIFIALPTIVAAIVGRVIALDSAIKKRSKDLIQKVKERSRRAINLKKK